ncbi:uncharacterized protein LOC131332599 [Rhododendron vialii]|uniref:uncharacterized protein LOC131332599 n=1 Tax=Rhododendron vialii TaxID=182163 RepID=UPI00265F3C56|nr:uncharacterized protein LOC131332599 [Rhododendron vialii]
MTIEWGCYVSQKEYQEIEQKMKEVELKRVPLTASPSGSKKLPPCKVTNLLKKTPSWLIIDAIISRTLNADKCIKSEKVFTKLVVAYNPKTDYFTIVGKNVKLTANHVKLIFGISCGTEPFAAKLKTREQVAFAKRHNIQQRLTTKAISDMLKELAQENKTNIEDVQDVAPEIHYELVESIKKSQHSPKDVKGCQLLLPYWLCEHTNILEQELSEHQVPRLLKWNISTLEHALQAIPNIVNTRKIKVRVAELTETDQEHKLYKMKFPYDDDDDSNGDGDDDGDAAADDDSSRDDGAGNYSLVNAEENDNNGDDDDDSDNDAAADDYDSPCDDGAGNYSPVNAEDRDDDNAHASGHDYLGLEDISQPNQHFQAQNPPQANELEVSKALLHISQNQSQIQRFISDKDSGSTLVPNTAKRKKESTRERQRALLLAIQNIKESHVAISEEKIQMELEFKEAAAKQEQQLTDAQMALIEEKKIYLD